MSPRAPTPTVLIHATGRSAARPACRPAVPLPVLVEVPLLVLHLLAPLLLPPGHLLLVLLLLLLLLPHPLLLPTLLVVDVRVLWWCRCGDGLTHAATRLGWHRGAVPDLCPPLTQLVPKEGRGAVC